MAVSQCSYSNITNDINISLYHIENIADKAKIMVNQFCQGFLKIKTFYKISQFEITYEMTVVEIKFSKSILKILHFK